MRKGKQKRISIRRDKYNEKLYGFSYGGKLISSGYVSKSGVKKAIEHYKKHKM